MAKCPKCEKEINYLNNYSRCEVMVRLYEDGFSKPLKIVKTLDAGDYECPKCNELLFTTEKEALAFLTVE